MKNMRVMFYINIVQIEMQVQMLRIGKTRKTLQKERALKEVQ